MLTITHSTRLLRFLRPGRLLPWLGPALRGLVARRFKGRAGQVHVGTHRVAGAGGWRRFWSEGSEDRWQGME